MQTLPLRTHYFFFLTKLISKPKTTPPPAHFSRCIRNCLFSMTFTPFIINRCVFIKAIVYRAMDCYNETINKMEVIDVPNKLKKILNVGKFMKNCSGKSGKFYLKEMSSEIGDNLSEGVRNIGFFHAAASALGTGLGIFAGMKLGDAIEHHFEKKAVNSDTENAE